MSALDGARDVLAAAREAHQAATADLVAAKSALERAGAEFNAAPSDEREAQCERCTRAVSKAQRYVDARAKALDDATRGYESHRLQATREERQALVAERAAMLGRLSVLLLRVQRIYRDLHETVSELESELASDHDRVQRINELAEVAKVREEYSPLSPELMRLAVGLRLGRSFKLPAVEPKVQFRDFLSELDTIAAPGDAQALLERFSHACVTFDSCVGDAELARWLALHNAPRKSDHSRGAELLRDAERVLEALDEARTEPSNLRGIPLNNNRTPDETNGPMNDCGRG